MKKHLLLAVLLIQLVGKVCSQTIIDCDSFFANKTKNEIIAWQKSIGDTMLNNYIDGMLKVGDVMPELSLGEILNATQNLKGKTIFSQLKGKPVIIDFWDTHCSTCIASFPHLEKLQEKFGNQIQILLFNPWENQATITKEFSRFYRQHPEKRLSNLPSMVGPRPDMKRLEELFPLRGIPHQIWIDGKGVIRIVGAYVNATEEKISELLAGKEISSIGDIANTPEYSRSPKPYYEAMGKTMNPLLYNSFFSNYNKYWQAYDNGVVESKVDSVNKTIRYSYVNAPPLYIIMGAYKNEYKAIRSNILYSPNKFKAFAWMDHFLLYVNDTLKYTPAYHRLNTSMSDKSHIHCSICYEQILPFGLKEGERRQYAFNDLKQIFGLDIGIEKKKMTCYSLVRTTTEKRLSSKKQFDKRQSHEIALVQDGKKCIQFNDVTMDYAFSKMFAESLIKQALQQYIIDETGYGGKIDIMLPDFNQADTLTLDDIRQTLQPLGLDIIQQERDIPFIVLREQGYKRK